ncbi:hypothetical protein CJI61_00265 [Brucella melitensis]|nr:hypothetical protein CJI61_00265 [Brucella melitensis]
MSDKTNDDKTLSVNPKKTLTLKRPGVEQSTVRQNFSHGRTKAVVVETKKRKFSRPDEKPEVEAAAAPKPAAPAAAPQQAPASAPVSASAAQASAPQPAPVKAPATKAPAAPVCSGNEAACRAATPGASAPRRPAGTASAPGGSFRHGAEHAVALRNGCPPPRA